MRISLRKHVNFCTCDNNRFIGVKRLFENVSLLFINVHLPYKCADNYDSYIQCLAELTVIIEEVNTSYVAVVGDLNASLSSQFVIEIADFCRKLNLLMSDDMFLPDDFCKRCSWHNIVD